MGWAVYVISDAWASIQQEEILDAWENFRDELK
jgi:hypothetical protein